MASVNKREFVTGDILEISRGDGTEAPNFDWSIIENLIVYDEHGCEIRVGDIYKFQKTILILVRVSELEPSEIIHGKLTNDLRYVP